MAESDIIKREYKIEVDDIFEEINIKKEIKLEKLEEPVEIEIKTRELSTLENIYDGYEVKEETQIISERQKSVWDDDVSDEIDNEETCQEINIFQLIDKYSTYKDCSTCKPKLVEGVQNISFCPKCFKNKTKEYICDICKKSMKHKCNLIRHMFRYHYKKKHVEKDMKKYIFECDICNRRFPNKNLIERHVISHNPRKPYKCDKCNKKFVLEIYFAKHMAVHGPNKKYTCLICSDRFKTEVLCKMHLHRKHKNNVVYKHNRIENLIQSDYDDPKFTTDNEKQYYKCDVCSTTFYGKTSLRKHLKELCMKKFICALCGKHYTTKSYLRIHMDIHLNKARHTCYICYKSYTKGSRLEHHMKRVHSTGLSKPFQCDSCSLTYVSKELLRRHIIGKHTQQPQFVCRICKQCFRYRSSLKRHMILHEGGFTYDCKYCYKYFMLKSNLISHMKTKHGL